MKSEIMLPNNKNLKAEGKIVIEYTNGETGEVENRFESENHVFPGGFLRQNNYWFSQNGSNSPFYIYVSDKGDDINYNIPLIPGNIIGYGYPGSNTNSTRLGSENINARNLGVYSDGKWHYKRQWSWLPSQITSEIKSFGIASFNSGSNDSGENSRRNMLPKQIPNFLKGNPSVLGNLCNYDSGKSYSFGGSSYVSTRNEGANISGTIYDLSKNYNQTAVTVNLKNLIPIPDDFPDSNGYFTSYSIFFAVDIDNNDIIIMFLYKTVDGNAAVQMTRFDPDLSQVKNNEIYQCGTYSNENSMYPFTGYSASNRSYGYCTKGKFYTLYSEKNTSSTLLAEINPSNWSNFGNFIDAFSFSDVYNDQYNYEPLATSVWSLACKNSCPIFLTNYSRILNDNNNYSYDNRPTMIIINSENNKAYASRYCYTANGSWFFGRPFIENIDGNNAIIQLVTYYSNDTDNPQIDGLNNYWRNLSDYTLYVLPDNAPKREEGQGVTITYEIAWGYEEDN